MRVDELLVELATDKLRRLGLLGYDLGDAEVVVVFDDVENSFGSLSWRLESKSALCLSTVHPVKARAASATSCSV